MPLSNSIYSSCCSFSDGPAVTFNILDISVSVLVLQAENGRLLWLFLSAGIALTHVKLHSCDTLYHFV